MKTTLTDAHTYFSTKPTTYSLKSVQKIYRINLRRRVLRALSADAPTRLNAYRAYGRTAIQLHEDLAEALGETAGQERYDAIYTVAFYNNPSEAATEAFIQEVIAEAEAEAADPYAAYEENDDARAEAEHERRAALADYLLS